MKKQLIYTNIDILSKCKWMFIRVFYYISAVLIVSTGGLYTFIIAPITSYYFFNSYAFWRYLAFFPKINIQAYRIFFIWLTDSNYREMYAQPVAGKPMSGPDYTKVRLAPSWETTENNCGDCFKCCTKIHCTLLDVKTGMCLSYGTIYWKYFSCGRFPVSQRQIDYYGCDKWEMKL